MDVPLRDAAAEAAARARHAGSAAAGLGRLIDLACWVASVQGTCPPRDFDRIRVVLFAGDHDVAAAADPAAGRYPTVRLVADVLAGASPASVAARQVGATVRVVDLAVDGDTPAEISEAKVARGSGQLGRDDASTAAETDSAFAAGQALADAEIDAGADLLLPGDLGAGNHLAAAVLIAALTDREPAAVTGRGAGTDDAGWMREVVLVRDALRRARRSTYSPMALLGCAAGAHFAAMTGFLLQAAVRRTPVLLDGEASVTCAVLADSLAPGAYEWWLAASRSPEPAQRLGLERLGLSPLLDLGLRLGDGTGSLLAVPVLRAAVAILAEQPSGNSPGGGADA